MKNSTLETFLTLLWLGFKVANYVVEVLKTINFVEIFIWSVSEISIHWVKNKNSNISYVKIEFQIFLS